MAEIDAGGQIAMFQKLLNSPLGALGKSLTGNPARSSAAVVPGRDHAVPPGRAPRTRDTQPAILRHNCDNGTIARICPKT